MQVRRSLIDKFWFYIYSLPIVTQLWARLNFNRITEDKKNEIPFTPLQKPLQYCKVALITTGGIHPNTVKAFDMDNPEGDSSFREIAKDIDLNEIEITHNYYNHSDAEKDLNIIFPLQHFRDLEEKGIIGNLASVHYSFMGHINGEQLIQLITKTFSDVVNQLKQEGVDVVFLTPA
jgi:D-proline reductase (dithiol) PrdB